MLHYTIVFATFINVIALHSFSFILAFAFVVSNYVMGEAIEKKRKKRQKKIKWNSNLIYKVLWEFFSFVLFRLNAKHGILSKQQELYSRVLLKGTNPSRWAGMVPPLKKVENQPLPRSAPENWDEEVAARERFIASCCDEQLRQSQLRIGSKG